MYMVRFSCFLSFTQYLIKQVLTVIQVLWLALVCKIDTEPAFVELNMLWGAVSYEGAIGPFGRLFFQAVVFSQYNKKLKIAKINSYVEILSK